MRGCADPQIIARQSMPRGPSSGPDGPPSPARGEGRRGRLHHDVADRCMGHISIAMCHPNNTNAENDVMQMDLDILESKIEAQDQNHDS